MESILVQLTFVQQLVNWTDSVTVTVYCEFCVCFALPLLCVHVCVAVYHLCGCFSLAQLFLQLSSTSSGVREVKHGHVQSGNEYYRILY